MPRTGRKAQRMKKVGRSLALLFLAALVSGCHLFSQSVETSLTSRRADLVKSGPVLENSVSDPLAILTNLFPPKNENSPLAELSVPLPAPASAGEGEPAPAVEGNCFEQAGLIRRDCYTAGLPENLTTRLAGHSLLMLVASGQTISPAPALDSRRLDLGPKAGLTESILVTAYRQAGRPYKNGGQSPQSGFDGAGYTAWVFGQAGLDLPKGANRQAEGGQAVTKERLRPGDLLIYRDPAVKVNGGYHVGIYTGGGNFIHAAPKTGLVTETAAFGPQFAPYFVGGRRYYDDPSAAPLSEAQKMAAASSAVKLALSELEKENSSAKRK